MGQSIFLTEDLACVQEKISPNILFKDFYQIYYDDMQGRLKSTALSTRHKTVLTKILPFFGELPMSDFTPVKIRTWQNQLLSNSYSDTYLKTIDMNLFSIFKYAENYYDLPNPYTKAGHIGSSSSRRMQFWTLKEYHRFIETLSDDSKAHTAFEILYWTGMRVGELLALTPDDIDHKAVSIRITKTYIRHDGHDLIMPPKTENSVRSVVIPDFLYREICDYIEAYNIKKNSRLFPHTADYLEYHLKKGCRLSGVKKIRIHDLRHSHVSLLINHGFSALDIAERVGHESVSTTLDVYSHLFPDQQQLLVKKLEKLNRQSQKYSAGRKKQS